MSTKKLKIIDYGMGNVGSVKLAFQKLGTNVEISDNLNQLSKADALVLPGVGAFPQAVQNFENRDLFNFLNEQIIVKKKPILGICLGMQLMAKESLEMGKTNGLGWFDAKVIPIKPSVNCRAPHVGWNNVYFLREDDFFKNIDSGSNFYFDHSYKFICNYEASILGVCEYEQKIVSVIRNGHIIGAQFHPEKSQRNGLKILRSYLNFVENYYIENF